MISWAQDDAEGAAPTDPESYEALLRYVNTLHDEVEVLKLRLDYKEYRRFADVGRGSIYPKFRPRWPYDGDTPEAVCAAIEIQIGSDLSQYIGTDGEGES